jgi:hypothetical protein
MKSCLILNYKFVDMETKTLFKNKVRAAGKTMQSSITSYINHIIGRQELFNESPANIKPKRIGYGYTGYEFFSVEKVFIDDVPNGEYHVKVNDNSSTQSALLFFQMNMPGFEVGIIDPILNLDYPLHMRTSDKTQIDNIDLIFSELNKKIEEFRKDM